MPPVFRWDITRPEQLGRLVDVELDTGFATFSGLLAEIRTCSARVIAMAGNSRLVFISRPKTWRWRRLDWAARFRPSALKGVAVPYWFWTYLGDSQKKVSQPNPPERWADPAMARPPRGPRYAEALRLAVALHDAGRSRIERDALAGAISTQHAVRERWCRALTTELRSTARRTRVDHALASKRPARSRNARYLPYR